MKQSVCEIDPIVIVDPERVRITDLWPHQTQHCSRCQQETDHVLAARIWRCGECGHPAD